MKFRRGTAAAAMVIGAMTIGLGTAHADPAPAPAQPSIDYAAKLVDKTVVTKLKGGTFELAEKPGAPGEDAQQVVNVKDPAGNIAMEMPLDFRFAGVKIPVKSDVKEDGTVLEITPDKPADVVINGAQQVAARPMVPAEELQRAEDAKKQADADAKTQAAAPVAKAQPIASATENQRAMGDFTTKFGLATAVGGFVGTAIGAAIGCVVTLPLACIPGLLTGAGVGGIIGTVVAGGPTLVAAGVDLVNTLQAPDGTTQWADPAQQAAAKQQAAAAQQPAN
ncbi:hypothetical protein IU500_13735 [Nocardia terpenica]|nr:hypothetical protein [Nocardia terpenica]MBF6062762.1 hypothetical protein [Nocardia terpenica]MBF6105103.1 hypothetical protein [Nocardia terpenica]MBF6112460.1 hypothetical protein [Nocardia terpenica]MBF6118831.1 hypothetical protein [Nocardia terpenica]MBF6154300.1 hypothetical protein [Nocardia terpenica]